MGKQARHGWPQALELMKKDAAKLAAIWGPRGAAELKKRTAQA